LEKKQTYIKMGILLFLMMFVMFPQEMDEDSIEVESFEVVTLTTYKSVGSETDSHPRITASGFKISKKNPKKHRIMAVSRDLKKKYPFGTKLTIKNAGKYNGEYVVEDVMNKRYKKRIDILINPKDKQTTIKGVKLIKPVS
jgi:3D (Asp-Asp-Asp) domain-containing protein